MANLLKHHVNHIIIFIYAILMEFYRKGCLFLFILLSWYYKFIYYSFFLYKYNTIKKQTHLLFSKCLEMRLYLYFQIIYFLLKINF